MFCMSPGSIYDNNAYALSELFKLLEREKGDMFAGFWVSADDAYTYLNRLLTPLLGKALRIAKDCFNYWQSSAKIHKEQSFGMLVGRWGAFWRPFKCTVAKNAVVIWVSTHLVQIVQLYTCMITDMPELLHSCKRGLAT